MNQHSDNYCNRCNVPMKIGKAIESLPDSMKHSLGGPRGYDDGTKLVDCWKCPQCGDSRDL